MDKRILLALLTTFLLATYLVANAGDYDAEAPEPSLISAEPPVKGNLLRNSSFELGWQGIWGDIHQAHEYQSIDDHMTYHGRRSICIQAAPERRVSLRSQFIAIKPFHRYTVSAYIKSSVPGTEVRVSARSGHVADDGANYSISETKPVGTQWKRVVTSGAFGRTPGPACSVKIEVLPTSEPAQVWVDAVQLEEGDCTEYTPAHPVEAALATGRAADLFFYDQARILRMSVVNYSGQNQRAAYRLRVTDFWNKELWRDRVIASLGPYERKELSITLPESLRGSLRVQARRDSDNSFESERLVSVAPRPLRPGLWPQSTIGNHLGTNEYILKVAQMIGIKWTRDHDCSTIGHWDVREPEPGEFIWADEEVDRIRRYGISVVPCLEKTPSWQGGGWTFPKSLYAWRRYVRKTVEHYRGRVQYWCIWNEGWGVSGEEYGQLVVAAYEAAHAADLQARIVFEYSTWQGTDKLDEARKAGVADHIDVAATHLYAQNQWRVPDEPGTGWTLSYNIRRLLDEYGTMAVGRPLWMTEGGLYHDTWRSDIILDAVDSRYSRVGSSSVAGAPWLTAEQATRYIPRYYVTWRAGGGDKWFYYWSPYVPRPDNPNSFVFFECDGSLHPMGVANAVMAHQLDGSNFVHTLDFGEINLKCHVFEQLGQGIAVLWWQGANSRKLSLPHLVAGVSCTDIMGNESELPPAPDLALTGDPIYLRKKGLSAQRLAQMLQPG